MKAARHAGERLEKIEQPELEATVMSNVGNEISTFVHDFFGTNPGPPTEPPGPAISAFVDALVPPSPVQPPETPPNPVAPGPLISDFVHDLVGVNPGPPTEPPGPLISAFVLELVGINPGPPDLLI